MYTLCSPQVWVSRFVLPMFCKKKSFCQRFTCTGYIANIVGLLMLQKEGWKVLKILTWFWKQINLFFIGKVKYLNTVNRWQNIWFCCLFELCKVNHHTAYRMFKIKCKDKLWAWSSKVALRNCNPYSNVIWQNPSSNYYCHCMLLG